MTTTLVADGGTALLIGLVAAALAAGLSSVGRKLSRPESRWYRWRIQLPLAFAAAVGATGLGNSWAEVTAFTVAAVGAALLITTDLAEQRLPDAITLPLYPVLYGLLAIAAAVDDNWPALLRAVLGGAVLLVVFGIASLLGPLYLGDVKLAGLLGGFLGWLGWWELAAGVLVGFGLQAALGVLALAARRAAPNSEWPLGPALIIGAGLSAWLGQEVWGSAGGMAR